jgi:hypothetical protein
MHNNKCTEAAWLEQDRVVGPKPVAEIERRLVTALQGLLRLMGIQPGAERMRSLFRRPRLHAEFIWGWNTTLREAQGGVPSAALRAAPADAVRQEMSSKGAFVLSEHHNVPSARFLCATCGCGCFADGLV